MELIEGSETSAISTVTPGNYPKENILQFKKNLVADQMEAQIPPNARTSGILGANIALGEIYLRTLLFHPIKMIYRRFIITYIYHRRCVIQQNNSVIK